MALDKMESIVPAEWTGGPTSKRTDHELMAAAKAGDHDAFGAIVTRYKDQIVNFLYRFLNDYEEAVDLSQETFVRVYFALERYHSDFAFSTYIYRIASNLAISEIRKRKRRRLFSLTGLFSADPNDDLEFQPRDGRRLPDEVLQDSELGRQLQAAISALPPKYRAAIILRDLEGRSYEEVADVLKLGIGTTKSRISRARGLVKERMAGYLDGK